MCERQKKSQSEREVCLGENGRRGAMFLAWKMEEGDQGMWAASGK